MPEIFLHSRQLDSVFELLGTKENSITFSLGWALSRCGGFLQKLLCYVLESCPDIVPSGVTVLLQESGDDRGKTDIEIQAQGIHIIIEAKRGWSLPNSAQLAKYVPRLQPAESVRQMILTMSECSDDFAHLHLPRTISGVPVKHVPWKVVDKLCLAAGGAHVERRILADLRQHLKKIVTMQNQESNWVYVVALSHKVWMPGLNFIQIVENLRLYFHPFGTGSFPNQASNYLGFRYGGKLQSVHHVESHEVITNFHPHFPTAPDQKIRPHLLYHLGPPILPQTEVRTGKIYRAGRRWAMLDLLLTSQTIAEASAKSRARIS